MQFEDSTESSNISNLKMHVSYYDSSNTAKIVNMKKSVVFLYHELNTPR